MLILVAALAACKKEEKDVKDNKDSKAETTKAVETTPEVTKKEENETTPEATETPAPTEEVSVTEAEPNPTEEAAATAAPTDEPEPTEETVPTAEPTEEVLPTVEPTDEPEPTEEDVPTVEPTDEPEITEKPEPADDGVDALGNAKWVYSIDKSKYVANITAVTDYGVYYGVKVNLKKAVTMGFDELSSRTVGDSVDIAGKKVTITGIYSLDEDSYFTIPQDSYVDGSRIVVKPENPYDFFEAEEVEEYEDPSSLEFAFVLNEDNNSFYAYDDWGWEDCYVLIYMTEYTGINMVVTDDTIVRPAYYSRENYGDDFTLTGSEYLKLREDEDEQESRNINIYDKVDMKITEVVGADGKYTGEIATITEYYMP